MVRAVFGSPSIPTFVNAVRRAWFSDYPRISSAMIQANLPNTMATAKGHLDFAKFEILALTKKTTDIADKQGRQDSFSCILQEIRRNLPRELLIYVYEGYIHFKLMKSRTADASVSYTHLTLPTIYSV